MHKKLNLIFLFIYLFYNCPLKTITALFYTGCPTTYQPRHLFNNFTTNEDIATTTRRTTDTFLFISHTKNVLLFKSRCNILISGKIIKELPGLVGSGTPCTCTAIFLSLIKVQLNLIVYRRHYWEYGTQTARRLTSKKL